MVAHFSKKASHTAAELRVKQCRKTSFPWETWSFWPKKRPTRGQPEEPKSVVIKKIRTEMEMTKETWIEGQCQEVEACLRKNNSKKAYQLVKDLTTEKQGKSTPSTPLQDKSSKCLTKEQNFLIGGYLAIEKQGKSTPLQDKSRKCLTKE